MAKLLLFSQVEMQASSAPAVATEEANVCHHSVNEGVLDPDLGMIVAVCENEPS